jgi:hypothetical protein
MIFYNDLEIPVSGVSDSIASPASGWAKQVMRADALKTKKSSGEEISAGAFLSVSVKTANYTLTLSDDVLLCNALAGEIIITMPAPSGCAGKVFFVKKTDSSSNPVRVSRNSIETIDGAQYKIITSQYSAILLISDGTNWSIL